MTTPAVNISEVIKGSYDRFTKSCNGSWTYVSTVPANIGIVQRIRGPSVNNRKESSGWRNPSSWSLDEWNADAAGTGEASITDYGSCSPNTGAKYSGSLIQGACFGAPSIVTMPGFPAWMSNAAKSRAYNKLKDSDVNLSVAFGERKETEELFVHNAKVIAATVRNFRRANPQKLWDLIRKSEGSRRLAKNIPQKWLEVQYGWNPLMQDIQGACKHLDRRERDGKAYYITARGKCKSDQDVYVGKAAGNLSTHCYWDIWQHNSFKSEIILYYYLNNPLARTFAQLGITNPAELIWELVPFSFVVDWFLPVGDWIGSWSADFGLVYRSGVQSEFTRVKAEGNPQSDPNPPTGYYSNNGKAAKWRGVRFRRTVLASPPAVGVPHFKNPLSAKHIANALSLLVQAFR